MNNLLERFLFPQVKHRLENNPAVTILGPRQSGKSTLAKVLISEHGNALYLDLESPTDLNKLRDPESFFDFNRGKLVCLDEIQRRPDLFPVLRGVIDRSGENGQLLILGSASRDLLRQSSETLAGRISYLELSPFFQREVNETGEIELLRSHWLRGGFPRSFLAKEDSHSLQWRRDFIRTFLERDVPQLGFRIPAEAIHRLWLMCAHSHGQLLNSSKFGESLGLSHNTVRSYIDLLAQTFLIRILPPFHTNLKKRLIKAPKVFIRDSGLLHGLLEIVDLNDLFGHPVFGNSWEGFVIENILSELSDWKGSFYRTAAGAEIDLVLEKGLKRIAVECKASVAPKVGKGFWNSLKDLEIEEAWIIAPVEEAYPISKNVTVSPLKSFIESMTPKI